MRSSVILLALAGCCLCTASKHPRLTVNRQSWDDHAPEQARRTLFETKGRALKEGAQPEGPVGSIQSLLPPISGTDSPVDDTTQSPYSSIGLLAIATVSGYLECSGTLIAPNAVLTAAHCIYDQLSSSAAYEITFVPGFSPSSSQPYPYGSARAVAIRFSDNIPRLCSSNEYFVHLSDSCLDGEDYAVVFLDTNFTQPTMLLGVNDTAFGTVDVTTAGYPGDRCNGTSGYFFDCPMWKQTCPQVLYNDIAEVVVDGCISYQGQAGSPIWLDVPGVGNVITGVLIEDDGATPFNYGYGYDYEYYAERNGGSADRRGHPARKDTKAGRKALGQQVVGSKHAHPRTGKEGHGPSRAPTPAAASTSDNGDYYNDIDQTWSSWTEIHGSVQSQILLWLKEGITLNGYDPLS